MDTAVFVEPVAVSEHPADYVVMQVSGISAFVGVRDGHVNEGVK